MPRLTTKSFWSMLVGAFCGSCVGAAWLGVSTWFDSGVGFFGSNRDWFSVGMVLGAIYGLIPGAVIGLLTGIFKMDRRAGLLTGLLVGLLCLALSSGSLVTTYDWLSALSILPLGGLVGFVIAARFGKQKS